MKRNKWNKWKKWKKWKSKAESTFHLLFHFSTFQLVHFLTRQLPPFAHAQPSIGNRPDSDAAELAHRMADRLAHPPYLAVASLADSDEENAMCPLVAGLLTFVRRPFTGCRAFLGGRPAQQLHVRGHRPPAVERDPAAQPADRLLIRCSGDIRLVGPFDFVTRMRQARGEIAVVCQQQQPFAVVVEAANRVDVFAHAMEQVDHRLTTLRIGAGGDDARRLVQQDVAMALRGAQPPAVNADVVGQRVGLDAHFTDRPAVDRDAPFLDQLLGRTPRGDARLRQDLLEAETRRTAVHTSMFSLPG